jgi:hypothetical protein
VRVINIKDIIRKDVPIYYRLLFTGVAVLELANEKVSDYRIDFTIETKATGQKEVIVSFLDEVDYPLLPVIRELKICITEMYLNGMLPD